MKGCIKLKILVTGGAGFIGSNFIKYILKNTQHQIYNIDKLTYAGNLNNLKEIEDNKNYNFFKKDICNKKAINNIIQDGIEIIINFAAESHVDKSIEDSNVFFQTNVLGTQILCDLAVKYNIKKFIQISTDEVYGPNNKDNYHSEEDKLNPTNPYAASKASADLLVLSYYKTHGLPINIVRSTNNYGKYQYPEKIIPLFITNLIQNKKVPIYGNGKQIRDWLHVKDHCKALKLIIEKGKKGEIYNISGNNRIQNLKLTKLILKYLNKPETMIKFVEDRSAHDYAYYINSKKIKSELNWKPNYSLKKGLKETIDWYKDNTIWWKKIVD